MSIKRLWSSRRFQRGALSALVIAGLSIRLTVYLSKPSLHLDECMLASSLVSRSWLDLIRVPLDYGQQAPIGFLLADHFVGQPFGTGELALRLWPFLCGLVSVFVFAIVSESFLPRFEARAFAIGLFAAGQPLITYGATVKQYSTEVLATLLLIWVSRALFVEKPETRQLAGTATVGALMLWFSFPAVFVLAAVATGAIAERLQRRSFSEMRRLAGVGVAWTGSFVLVVLTSLRRGAGNESLREVWASAFLPIRDPARVAPWLLSHFQELAAMSTTVKVAPVGLMLLCLGCVSLVAVKRHTYLLVLLGAVGLCLVASAAEHYPFSGRLVLFAVPIVLLVMANGAEYLIARAPARLRGGAVCFVLGIALICLGSSIRHLVLLHEWLDHPREVLAALAANHSPGDRILVSSLGEAPFRYYARQLGLSATEAQVGSLGTVPIIATPDGQGSSRLWLFFMRTPWQEGGEGEAIFRYLAQSGRLVRKFDAELHTAALFELPSPRYFRP